MIQFRPANAGALDAARYVVFAAAHRGTSIDHLLLQQLLFAVQGWSLADRGRPLFADTFEAWPLGPVAPAVYREFEPFGMEKLPTGEEPPLSDEDKALIEEVVLAHLGGDRPLSSGSQGAAWRQARGNLPPAKSSRRSLTLDAIHEEFVSRADRASAAIDRRLDSLTRAGARNAKLLLGRSPISDA